MRTEASTIQYFAVVWHNKRSTRLRRSRTHPLRVFHSAHLPDSLSLLNCRVKVEHTISQIDRSLVRRAHICIEIGRRPSAFASHLVLAKTLVVFATRRAKGCLRSAMVLNWTVDRALRVS